MHFHSIVVLFWALPYVDHKVEVVKGIVREASVQRKCIADTAAGKLIEIMSIDPTNQASIVGMEFSVERKKR